MNRWNRHRWMTLWAATGLFAACGGSEENGDGNGNDGPVEIRSFTRDPDGTVNSGSTVTLSWRVVNADQVRIVQDPGTTIYDGSDAQGNVGSEPITTATTFTLTAVGADGAEETDSIQIPSEAIEGITIDTFQATTEGEIRSGDPIDFTYSLSGATQLTSVSVRDDEGNTPLRPNMDPVDLSLSDLSGTFTILADVPDGSTMEEVIRTYTLTVEAGGLQVSADEQVTISAAPPEVTNFETTANEGRTTYYALPASQQTADNRVGVTWTVENTEEVAVFFDDTDDDDSDRQLCRRFGRPGPTGCINDPGGCTGSATCNLDLLVGDYQVILVARSPTGVEVEEPLPITVVPDIQQNTFNITPGEFWQASIDAQVSWDVDNASTVQLQRCNGALELWQDVNLPGVTSDSFEVSNEPLVVEATGGVNQRFRLLSTIRDGQGRLVKPTEAILEDRTCSNDEGPDDTFPETSVEAGFNEPEPNNDRDMTAPQVTASPGAGDNFRGTLSDVNDVDVFRLDTTAGNQLMVFGVTGDGCANNSLQLQAFDEAGNALTPRVDSAIHDGILGPCPELFGAQTGFDALMELPGGTVYIEVTGKNLPGSAEYVLVLEENEPLENEVTAMAHPNVDSITQVGLPEWQLADLQVFSAPYGTQGMNGPTVAPFFAQLESFLPNHTVGAGLFALVSMFETNDSHVIPYDLELQYGLRHVPLAGATAIGVDIPATELGIDDGMADPASGVGLGMTLVPTSSVGTALDYQLAGNTEGGPIIPDDVFPLNISLRFQQPFDDPLYQPRNMAGDVVLIELGYPNMEGTTPFTGTTHMHMVASMSRWVFEQVPDLFDNDFPNSTNDDFLWVLEIRDANDNGYDLEVSFSVVP
ncbi:MAG TPA: hypothetical protein RMG48_16770 [Myxococcales bacterium LLY-WYZ-16_1]|nr:hypothetical protein [Myxococcales bacterium LLY-WYZ-16_1]